VAVISVTTTGAAKIAKAFKEQAKRLGGSPKCEVGTGTKYGVFVHEHTWKEHKPPTEAKFMERALDKLRPSYASKLAEYVRKYASAKRPLHMALYAMGLLLDADIVPRIPVLTGRLRASHYVVPPDGIAGGGSAPTSPGGE